jgi:hypothetical protein
MNNAQLSHAQDEYESGIEYDVDYSLVAWLSGEPSFESETRLTVATSPQSSPSRTHWLRATTPQRSKHGMRSPTTTKERSGWHRPKGAASRPKSGRR